jgi:hypothetical protein
VIDISASVVIDLHTGHGHRVSVDGDSGEVPILSVRLPAVELLIQPSDGSKVDDLDVDFAEALCVGAGLYRNRLRALRAEQRERS